MGPASRDATRYHGSGFDGDDFIVGLPLLDTAFDVITPPHEVDGRWMMTVDGVDLGRR